MDDQPCGLCRYYAARLTNQNGTCAWPERFAPFLPRSVIADNHVSYGDVRPCHAWRAKDGHRNDSLRQHRRPLDSQS